MHLRKLILLNLLFSLSFSFTSYAEVDSIMDYIELPSDVRTNLANNLIQHQEFMDSNYGGDWVEDESGCYSFYDHNGNEKYGQLYDSKGEIYYKDKNSSNIILDGYKSTVYFDSIGRMLNASNDINNKYLDKFKELEKNGYVIINNISSNETDKFIDSYEFNYCLLNQGLKYGVSAVTNGYKITLNTGINEYTEDVYDLILNHFKPLKGENDYEKIVSMCEQIRKITYDLSYINSNISDCLRDNRGVCWHYTKIGKVLLENAGITSEILPCICKSNGEQHVILRIKLGDKWEYCDPTNINSLGYTEAILPYSSVIERYDFISVYK